MNRMVPMLAVCVLAVCSPSNVGAQAADELSAELKRLRDRVDALQRRIDTQTAAPGAGIGTGTGESPANPTTSSSSDSTRAHPSSDEAVPPGKIRYKGVSITLGGFVAAEYIYREHNQENDISTNFGAVPYGNNALGHTRETRFTARQTRFSALVQGEPSPQTHLSFYSEFDFQGAAQSANSNQTNSYNPRIRHLYGAVDWDELGLHVIAGQTWSLVTMNGAGITPRNEVTPPTIDGQYLPGFSWTRQPQLRITKDFDQKFWVAMSLENPQTTLYTGANPLPADVHVTYNAQGGQGFDTANTLSINHIPDVVGKAAYEFRTGNRPIHLEAFCIYRSFYERLNYRNDNAGGGGCGAGLMVPLLPQRLDLQVSGLAGKGLGRYGSAQLTDATFDPSGRIRPIRETEALMGMTLHVSPQLDIYLFAGQEKESAQSYTLVTASGPVQYGYGNPEYSNTGCFSETATGSCTGNTRLIEQGTLGFWYKPYIGSSGVLRYGLQYSHTERKAFDGIGGAPIGDQNIVLATLRYYPF